jgi:hypothetical protein
VRGLRPGCNKTAPWCRFPESENGQQFWDNLLTGRDMVTENARRWPVGLHETPKRFGKLIEYHLFDAPFFSVHGKQAQVCTATVLWNMRHAALQPCHICCVPVTRGEANVDRGADTVMVVAENGPANAENVGGVI